MVMRRVLFATLVALGLLLVNGMPALADFPEQPGTHVATACDAVGSNPGTGLGGVAGQNESPTAVAITSVLYADACLGQ
jgi:hypothetical protein